MNKPERPILTKEMNDLEFAVWAKLNKMWSEWEAYHKSVLDRLPDYPEIFTLVCDEFPIPTDMELVTRIAEVITKSIQEAVKECQE